MRALVTTYALVRGIALRDLFRSAYISTFDRDLSSSSLDDDVRSFTDGAPTPPYVIKYFLKIIGAKHESTSSQDDRTDADAVQALRRAGL